MSKNYRVYFVLFIIFATLAAGSAAISYNRIAGMVTVAAARQDLSPDEAASEQSIGTMKIPRGALQSDTIRVPESLKGYAARGYIPSGTVLRKSMFRPSTSVAAKLKPGQVAIAIENNINTTVGNNIRPGNKVNITATVKTDTKNEGKAELIASDVEVLSLNDKAVTVALDQNASNAYIEAKANKNIDFALLPARR